MGRVGPSNYVWDNWAKNSISPINLQLLTRFYKQALILFKGLQGFLLNQIIWKMLVY